MSDYWHVYPVDDLREHITSDYPRVVCWCRPVEQEEGQGVVVVHNALDQRERYEGS